MSPLQRHPAPAFLGLMVTASIVLSACAAATEPSTSPPGTEAPPTISTESPTAPPEGGGAEHGGTLVMALNAAPVNLNPILSLSSFDIMAYSSVFDGLLALDENLSPEGALAESWTVSDDGLEWTFHLRPGVTWHDGVNFTADDVKFTFDTVMNPAVNSPLQSTVADVVESVEVVDPLTVRIRTFEQYGPLLTLLGGWQGLKIVPRHLLEGEADLSIAAFNRAPVGTGPFAFVSWNSEDIIELKRFANYWGGAVPNIPGTAYVDRFVIKVIADPNAANAQLITGEADLVSVRQNDYLALKDNPNVQLFIGPTIINTYLALNHVNPLFQDPTVRMALAHGIDREGIVKVALQELGAVINSPMFPSSWAYDPSTEGMYAFDPQRAGELLAEAGWVDRDSDGILIKDGQRFEFGLQEYSEWEPYVQAAQIIQDNLGDLGIKVNLELSEYNTWFSTILTPGEFDATIWAYFQTDPDLTNSLSCGAFPPNGQNWFFYCNEEGDRLLLEGRRSLDVDTRRNAYFEYQQLFAQELPFIPLFAEQVLWGASDELQNFRMNAERYSGFIYSMWLKEP
ncbi:MAG: ABC transporter substrate-binding protein [Anaerolineales bacterium]